MTFLAPLVLAGLAAVGAPIVLHLLNRSRHRPVRWAAMKFLQEAQQKNRRRLEIEEWILLLLRCLLVVVLVLAFCRPVLNPDGLDTGFNPAARVAVIVLDQTASMGWSDGALTRFEAAREGARRYLGTLGAGSRVAVLPVTGRDSGLAAGFSADPTVARQILEAAELSAGTNDWAAVLRQALAALQPFEGARREVVIFTDGQAAGWEAAAEIAKLREENPGVDVRVIPSPARDTGNVAIVALKPETALATRGQPFACLVEVANFRDEPVENIRVTLAADREAPADEKLIPSLAPGATELVRLAVRFDEPGHHTVTAAIPRDRLPADDRRSVAVRVVDEVNVVVIDEAADRAGFFLENALRPVPADGREAFPLKVQRLAPAGVAAARLDTAAAVFVTDPAALTADAVRKLRAYVERGGALVVFPGRAVPAGTEWAGLLPARLEGPTEADGAGWSWQADNFLHPVTTVWNGEPAGGLDSVRTARRYTLVLPEVAADAADRPQVVVSYADGPPAIVEKPLGKGRVVVFSAPLDTTWTNLPIHPNFVPLISRILGHVAQGAETLRAGGEAGRPVLVRVARADVGRNVLLEKPGAEKPVAAGRVAERDQDGVIVIRETFAPGPYRVFFENSQVPVAAFAVAVPRGESELTARPDEPSGPAAVGDRSGFPTAGGQRRDLWGFLLLLAGGLAVLEMVLAHRFSLAK